MFPHIVHVRSLRLCTWFLCPLRKMVQSMRILLLLSRVEGPIRIICVPRFQPFGSNHAPLAMGSLGGSPMVVPCLSV